MSLYAALFLWGPVLCMMLQLFCMAHAVVCPRGEPEAFECEPCLSMRNLEMLSSRGIALPHVQLYDLNCTHVFSLCKNDGVGAQIHAQISVMAYARAKGLTYIHAPIVELAHFAGGQPSFRMAAQMAAQMDNFFNLGFGEMTLPEAARQNITACGVKHCHRFFDSHAGAAGGPACYNSIKFELLQKYLRSPKPPPPLSTSLALSVAIHVRRGDVSRDAEADRYTSNEFYASVLSGIKSGLPSYLREAMDICIVSEGSPSDFESIVRQHPSTRLVLATDLEQSMHLLASADVLVMAKSSFSYLAALFNTGMVVYERFWHAPNPDWLEVHDLPILFNTTATHNFLANRMFSRNWKLQSSCSTVGIPRAVV